MNCSICTHNHTMWMSGNVKKKHPSEKEFISVFFSYNENVQTYLSLCLKYRRISNNLMKLRRPSQQHSQNPSMQYFIALQPPHTKHTMSANNKGNNTLTIASTMASVTLPLLLTPGAKGATMWNNCSINVESIYILYCTWLVIHI